MKYYQILISSENERQANAILDALLQKKLVLGGPILKGPAKFWWRKKIVSMGYCFVLTYSIAKLKGSITREVEKVSEEEVPMISFMPFEPNQKLRKLIDQTLK